MGLTQRTVADRRAGRRRALRWEGGQARRIERWALLAGTLVFVLGLLLVIRARLGPSEPPPSLADVTTAADLLPHLDVLADPDDRRFAAEQTAAFLEARAPLPSVEALRGIRVSEEAVARVDGLDVYRERLANAQRAWSQLDAPPEQRTIALFTASDVDALAARLAVRGPADFRVRLWLWALLYLGAFYAVHLGWRLRGGGDELLLPMLHLLTAVGFLMMVSLRDPLRDALLFPGYALGVVVGLAGLFAASRVDFERSVGRRLAYVPLVVALALSLLVVLFGSGPAGSGARINLVIAGVRTQPVELVKALLVFFFAGYFATRWEALRSLRLRAAGEGEASEGRRVLAELLGRLGLPHPAYALPVVLAVGLALVFFFLQRDLGPALIVTCLFLSLYAVARGRLGGALLGLGALVVAFWVGYRLGVPSTVAQRIGIWLAPWSNEIAYGGNHLAHGFWALATGGLTGTGLGLGAPAYVPQAHTDFVLVAIGEELGWLGLVGVLGLYGLLLHRTVRIARSAPGAYSFFLVLGVALLTAYQLLLIGGGVLGLLPLSGVITPFLNIGKSSMVVGLGLFGVAAAVARTAAATPEAVPAALAEPARWAVAVVLGGLAVLGVRAALIQVVAPDATLVRGVRTVEADGVQRLRYNPRLLAAADRIPRGTIYDARGVPVAVSAEVDTLRTASADVSGAAVGGAAGGRRYPFGPLLFHLLGDIETNQNMGAPNAAYIEREDRARLRGYTDLDELVPLVRRRHDPDHPEVQALLARERDVHLTLDVRLQERIAEAVRVRLAAAGLDRAAVVVLDAETGGILASVTYPYEGRTAEALLDRVRYGVYPPGSTFKLVTALAALAADPAAAEQTYTSEALAGGGAGAVVRGWSRPVREAAGRPFGSLTMEEALVVSSNAYFAQLGTYDVGTDRLLRMLKTFGMDAGLPGEPDSLQTARLADALPQAAIGQGSVLARPVEMARVAATIANDGLLPTVHLVEHALAADAQQRVVTPEAAALLARAMRGVVTRGTGRVLADLPVPVAGKTGTAEVAGSRSHAWFTGFAPYDQPGGRIAFAVVVEEGGAGGRVAAQIAGDVVAAAAAAELITP